MVDATQIKARPGAPRVEPQRCRRRGTGISITALGRLYRAEAQQRLDVLGLAPQRLAEGVPGFFQTAEACQRVAQLQPRRSQSRGKLLRPARQPHRSRGVPGVELVACGIRPNARRRGGQSQRRPKRLPSAAVVAEALQHQTEVIPDRRVAALQRYCSAQVALRGLRITLGIATHAQ